MDGEGTKKKGADREGFAPLGMRGLEELFGVLAGGVELGEFLDNSGTVGCVGHAKPLGVGVEDFDGGFAAVDECVDDEGDEEFGFGGVEVAIEEVLEFALAEVEVVGRESPEVHRDGSVGLKFLLDAVFVGKDDFVLVVVADCSALND